MLTMEEFTPAERSALAARAEVLPERIRNMLARMKG